MQKVNFQPRHRDYSGDKDEEGEEREKYADDNNAGFQGGVRDNAKCKSCQGARNEHQRVGLHSSANERLPSRYAEEGEGGISITACKGRSNQARQDPDSQESLGRQWRRRRGSWYDQGKGCRKVD